MTDITSLSDEDVKLFQNASQLLDSQDYTSAADIYTSLLKDNPLPVLYIDRARCFYNSDDYNSCVSDIKSALEIEPKNVEACALGGQASAKLEQYDTAYSFYKSGLQAEPGNKTVIECLKDLQKLIIKDYESKAAEDERKISTLQLSSQDPYPGDDMLLKLEQEILLKKYKIPQTSSSPATMKRNPVEAVQAASEAQRCHLKNKLPDAIYYLNAAIEMDPFNWLYRQLRGEVYFQKGEPFNALRDLWSIPKQSRLPDLWKLGGKILREMNSPIHAELWLRKATKLSEGKDEEAALIFQKIRVNRLYSPLSKTLPVYVDFTEYGRALFADRDIKAGEKIFGDAPVILAQSMENLHISACSHCALALMKATDYFGDKWGELDDTSQSLVREHWPDPELYWCQECKREKYCSEECRSLAWKNYHQVYCPGRNPASTRFYDMCDKNGWGNNDEGRFEEIWDGHYNPVVFLKIWGSIVAEAKRLMKEENCSQPTQQHWGIARAPFRKFIAYGNSYASQKMPLFLSILKKIFADCGDGVKYDITDNEFNGRYYQATCNLQAFSSYVTQFHHFLTKLEEEDPEKVIRLFKYIQKKPPEASFAGMFPLHACLNHACNNNVEVSDDCVDGHPGVSVRAKLDIKKGDELYTTYIDTTMQKKLRRAWLYRSFNFWCHCKRCQFEGEDAKSCTNCGTKTKGEKKFSACGGCKKAWYCSTQCQKAAWIKGHKEICKLSHSYVEPNDIDRVLKKMHEI